MTCNCVLLTSLSRKERLMSRKKRNGTRSYLEVLGLLVLNECLLIREGPITVVTPGWLLVLPLLSFPHHSCDLASAFSFPYAVNWSRRRRAVR